jgi:hypothetical protein
MMMLLPYRTVPSI